MAGITKVNGGDNTVGTLESVAQLDAYIVTVCSTSNGDDTAVDLRANDGAAGSLYDLFLQEVQPLMAHATNDANGTVSIIVDGHANDAASLASRIEALDGVGTDTTVVAASSITVA